MKTKRLTSCFIAWCLIMVLACENEQIAPVYENNSLAEKTSPDASKSDGSARKRRENNSMTGMVTGTIKGQDFTGDFTVSRFTESAGMLLAEGHLTNVKLTGQDHKNMEFILQQQMYTIPVTLDGMATAAETFQIAAACTVLNLNFNGLTTDVLGLAVVIDPITITINANDDEVLGNLICTALDTVNSVVDLVGILNDILGLLSL